MVYTGAAATSAPLALSSLAGAPPISRLMVKVLLVVVAAAVWVGASHEREKRMEHRLAVIASEIAARPVAVDCQSFAAELIDVTSDAGRVEFDRGRPADVTKLKRKVCGALERLRHDAASPKLACVDSGTRCPPRIHAEIWAATVLAHESMHLAGEIREDIAECKAVQVTPLVAQRLGVSEELARAIAGYSWRYVYPEAREDYRSLDCFSGGPYDLRPADPRWP